MSNRVELVPVSPTLARLADSNIFLSTTRTSREPYEVLEDGVVVASNTSVTQALSIAVSRYHQLQDFRALLAGKPLPSRIASRRKAEGVEKAGHVTSPSDPT